MKKLIALLLALVMVLGLVACGKGAEVAEENDPVSVNPATGASAEATEEPTNIVWMVGFGKPNNYDAVMAEINKKLLNDLNMTLELRFSEDYVTTMQMEFSSGEAGTDWDLCFTSNWMNNFVDAATKGAYLAVDSYLEEYAPDILANFPEALWDAAKVNGSIYALPNYQVAYEQAGWAVPDSLVEELNLDISSIVDYESFEKVLMQIKAAYPDSYAIQGGNNYTEFMFLDNPVVTVASKEYLTFNEATGKVSGSDFADIYRDAWDYAKYCMDNDLVAPDAATLKDGEVMQQQKLILSNINRCSPGGDDSWSKVLGYDVTIYPISEKAITTLSIQSTLTAVNVHSKHPEKAIELFNYLWANKEFANMLYYGLEGQDYEKIDDNTIRLLPDCWSVWTWGMGNSFNAYLTEGQDPNMNNELLAEQATVKTDVLFGFIPNVEAISAELAACDAIYDEYNRILVYGLTDDIDGTIAEMLGKLEAAGMEAILAEFQPQVEAFLSAK